MTLTTSTLYRLRGHAGLWYFHSPAIVVTDDDSFEHPDLVLVSQAADPDNTLVVEPSMMTAFVIEDAPVDVIGTPEPLAVTA